ncbi:hypothetical protein LZC95_48730 [Pendulispora brunnea]|uniref:Uncharacterized protein n=1 Tax=Pendulispora brunnea TaxID=2905690 RepID=A0ABZ2K6K6_9BACT
MGLAARVEVELQRFGLERLPLYELFFTGSIERCAYLVTKGVHARELLLNGGRQPMSNESTAKLPI